MRKQILILAPTPYVMNVTLARHVKVLSEHDIDVAVTACDGQLPENCSCQSIDVSFYTNPGIVGKLMIAFLSLSRMFGLIFKLPGFKKIHSLIAAKQYDLIIVQGVIFLPAVFDAKAPHTKVFLDAQEYYPREFEESFVWKLIKAPIVDYLCKKYLHRLDKFTTLGTKLAEEYTKKFGVACDVIYNDMPAFNITPKPILDDEKIKLIHHGAAMPARKIELMIDVASYLDDRFTLTLMLMPSDKAYYEQLVERAKQNKRVNIIPPVPTKDLIETAAEYHIGLFLIHPANFSYLNCCPTKFWQFIQSGLCLATGPFPELQMFIERYQLGVFSKTFEPKDLAEKINKLSVDDINTYRQHVAKAARELCSEYTEEKLRSIIFQLLHT